MHLLAAFPEILAAMVTYLNLMLGKCILETDLEAYSGQHGSWWDVEILETTNQKKYLKVHYAGFSEQEDEWIPVTHLRIRSRPCEYSHDYCDEIYPGMDVSVMIRHPDSDEDSEVPLAPLPVPPSSLFLDIAYQQVQVCG